MFMQSVTTPSERRSRRPVRTRDLQGVTRTWRASVPAIRARLLLAGTVWAAMAPGLLSTTLFAGEEQHAMEPIAFTHMADASAGEWLGDNLFVAASDEDNVLRVYRLPQGGAPIATWDASPWMALDKKKPEMDIEGSAKIGDTVYWITSHAPNREGKPRPNRKRFFATRISVTNGTPSFSLIGKPVTTLLAALDRDPRYAGFGLAAAALRPPKTPGSLNIEALCDAPEGGLLIGFRSPNPKNCALLAFLANPAATVSGQPPVFGDPILLDLNGNGIRAMTRIGECYLIMSGSPLSGGTPQLFRWNTQEAPKPVPLRELPADAHPEGLVLFDQNGQHTLLVLSDDGTRLIGGVPAKELADPARRTFRGFCYPFLP